MTIYPHQHKYTTYNIYILLYVSRELLLYNPISWFWITEAHWFSSSVCVFSVMSWGCCLGKKLASQTILFSPLSLWGAFISHPAWMPPSAIPNLPRPKPLLVLLLPLVKDPCLSIHFSKSTVSLCTLTLGRHYTLKPNGSVISLGKDQLSPTLSWFGLFFLNKTCN